MIRSAVSDRMAKGRNLGGERHRHVASSLKHGRPRGALIMSLRVSLRIRIRIRIRISIVTVPQLLFTHPRRHRLVADLT